MDSESSSSQSTSQADNRNVLGEAAILAQSGSSVTQIDNRVNYALDGDVANAAIKGSTENLGKSLTFASGAMTKSYDFAGVALAAVQQSGNRALDSLAQSNSMVKDAYADAKGRGALTDQITIGALALAGLMAFAAIKGKA